MAIISCPFCGQKISDKSTQCNHCGKDLSALTTEKLNALSRDKRLALSQSLMNQTMLAMLLFLGGFGAMYWWQPETGSAQQYLFIGISAVGFLWYLVTRVRIILLKRRSKKYEL